MIKLLRYGRILAGLLYMALLLTVRWIVQVPYFLCTILLSLSELIINGASEQIARTQTINNELIEKTEQ